MGSSPSSSTAQASSGTTLRKALRLPLFSGLQGKLIIPYALLTLLLAMIGVFVITRLVTSSLRERFINQLYEASRVTSDSIVRLERNQLETLRLMAFTQGVAEAVPERDVDTLKTLLYLLGANHGQHIITVADLQGQALLSLEMDLTTKQYQHTQGEDLIGFEPVAKVLNRDIDDTGDKFAGIREARLGPAFFNSSPLVDASGKLTGVLLVGTYLQSFLDDTKTQALADILLISPSQTLLVTTLPPSEGGYVELEALAQQALASETGAYNLTLYERDYQVVFSEFRARNGEVLGWLGVTLPLGYVASTEATSRNYFSLLFTLGTGAVIVIGFLLSRSIARPILALRAMSQEVASGNLDQEVGIQRSDEIGELAVAFDQMTLQLRERTAEAARLYAETVQRNKELAQINLQLQNMQNQLIQSEKLAAIGQLTAGIVHDVKNPLAVIKGLAELIQGDELPEEMRESIRTIYDSADRANRIISDLLKFARQSEPEKKYQDLRETISACLRLTAYLIRKGSVEVITDLPESPVYLWYDAQQIEQVFINLIQNAVQAMPKGGHLRVSLSGVPGAVAVAFQDTGTGISPEHLHRIFDPFFTTKPEGQGTGLGLSVSYGIISNHDGQITVESTLGEGTTFMITLPVADELLEEGMEV